MNRHSVTLSLVEWEVARIYHLLNRRDASKLEGWQAQCLQMFVVITRGCRFGWKHKCMKLACCLSLDCESVTKETVFHKNWSSSSGGSDNCDSFSRIHCTRHKLSLGQALDNALESWLLRISWHFSRYSRGWVCRQLVSSNFCVFSQPVIICLETEFKPISEFSVNGSGATLQLMVKSRYLVCSVSVCLCVSKSGELAGHWCVWVRNGRVLSCPEKPSSNSLLSLLSQPSVTSVGQSDSPSGTMPSNLDDPRQDFLSTPNSLLYSNCLWPEFIISILNRI